MWVRDIKVLSPVQFELMVKKELENSGIEIKDFIVKHNDRLTGMDGEYNIDITVKYELLGVSFVVLVECKNHSNPIKRELVQSFKEKISSIGAHKGIMFSSAKFQSGAVEYAVKHGIALIQISEGSMKFINRSLDKEKNIDSGFMFWLVYMKDEKIHYSSENIFIEKYINSYLSERV